MLKLPISCLPVIQHTLDIFKFKLKQGAYSRLVQDSFVSKWGDEYENDDICNFDIAIGYVDSGNISYSVDRLISNDDRAFISKHIDSATLYVTYNVNYEYVFRCGCDLSDDASNPLLIEFEAKLDSTGSTDTCEIAYDQAFTSDPRISYLLLMQQS